MEPITTRVNSLKIFFNEWQGDLLTSETDPTPNELITRVALNRIGATSVDELQIYLTRTSLDAPELSEKIDYFRSLLLGAHSLTKAQLETQLGLDTWDAGPKTAIAKIRILACYLKRSTILNLNNLGLRSIPASIGNFTFLTKLNCRQNLLEELPPLPYITHLNCGDNQLSELPNLPSIAYLDCDLNNLTELPLLPYVLRLDCSNNYLIALPNLPLAVHLNCGHNDLDNLPNLPFVTYLDCSNNDLSELTPLPLVIHLYCNENLLSTLPNLPFITHLDCSSNHLAELPNLPLVIYLNCSDNDLEVLPAFTFLSHLYCGNNHLTLLHDLPFVVHLCCENNYLTELPALPLITYLDCRNNDLTALSDFPLITDLFCSRNYLTAFPAVPNCLNPDFEPQLSYGQLAEPPPPNARSQLTAKITHFQTMLGSELPPSAMTIELDSLDAVYIEQLYLFLDKLSSQLYFQNEDGKKLLGKTFLSLISLTISDADFREIVINALGEALSTCTDRALYYLNQLTVARKIKESVSEGEKIVIMKGAFAFSHLDDIAGNIIELRLEARAAALGRPLSESEIELIKREEIELYLALQIQLKPRFNLPIDSTAMQYAFCANLQPAEIDYATARLTEKLANRDDCIKYFLTHPSWTDSLLSKYSSEYATLIAPQMEKMAELKEKLDTIKASEKELASTGTAAEQEAQLAAQLDISHQMAAVMIEKNIAEARFLYQKTEELLARPLSTE